MSFVLRMLLMSKKFVILLSPLVRLSSLSLFTITITFLHIINEDLCRICLFVFDKLKNYYTDCHVVFTNGYSDSRGRRSIIIQYNLSNSYIHYRYMLEIPKKNNYRPSTKDAGAPTSSRGNT